MPSPFPGVDPYIEDQHFWPDFHHRFMTYWCDFLLEQLPTNYDARLEERIRLVERTPRKREHRRQPDIAIERRESARGMTGGTTVVNKPTLEPIVMGLPVIEEIRHSRINIIHRADRELVTVLELLSPDNKRGMGFDAYLERRSQLHFHDPAVHLVELDLLLRGRRLPMSDPLPAGDFYCFVRRVEDRDHAEVYAWTLRDDLPVIPIPLRRPTQDLHSSIAQVFRKAYEQGRYQHMLEYGNPLRVPMSPADLRWAMKVAKARKKT